MFIPDDWVANEYDARGGVTIQFIDPQGEELFQVSTWPYQDLVVHADGLLLQSPSQDDDQPNELAIVHVFRNDLFEISFVKEGISYVVQSLPQNAASTLDILKSWEFI